MTAGRDSFPPLYGVCDGCGSPDGVLWIWEQGSTDHYCPRCAQKHASYTAAYDQLERLVREVVMAWVKVWMHLPGMPDLDEHLHQIGLKLDEQYKAGKL